ncbi:N-acetylmuramoyl-L-alanine amidase [Streptomyces sp. ICN441]|uniref:peptidoglycan recognition protein family protein n=1 Tax=Streptomyces sp. ICN441 TaxID=2558286 RepID=UPI00106C51EF|nr:peptidoglycan recognition protein [Streptomyces sp. ICN441]TFE48310.1 N-acetylmuramoyl-L-alanine amidase [Streptomyces sp. ICN441]
MRAYLASSIGAACTAALVLPALTPEASAASRVPDVPGSTQSLPLVPLPGRERAAGGTVAQGLPQRETRPFSLVGVVWEDPDRELHASVQVRTRATGSGAWSPWQNVESHDAAHAPDPGSPERAAGTVRGATAPLWVGASDAVAVRVRVRPESAPGAPRSATPPLPGGLRLELVDPGDGLPQTPRPETPQPELPQPEAPQPELPQPEVPQPEAPQPGSPVNPAPQKPPPLNPLPERPEIAVPGEGVYEELPGFVVDPALTASLTPESAAASAVNADLAPLGADAILPLTKAETEAQAMAYGFAKPYIGPRPGIVTRKGWGADEALREKQFVYTKTVQAAFVHHTATGNRFTCAQSASVLRSIYRYHVESSGWRDIGYNFAVDKCGNIYEGRAGGVAKPVLGAHTRGFNTNSMGIAVLGTYSSTAPPKAAVEAIAKLTAWKLGLFGVNPKSTTYLTSGGGNKYAKGTKAKLNVISGHRDGFATDCPGTLLYGQLGTARTVAARLQGR